MTGAPWRSLLLIPLLLAAACSAPHPDVIFLPSPAEVVSHILDVGRNADTAGVLGSVELRHADMFETDLGAATVVALYLSPALNERLRPKLFREVRPGARIVSHNFPMGDWRPDTAVRVAWPSGAASVIYGWTMPADVAGNWTVEVDGDSAVGRYRLRLAQRYQEVEGTASRGGRSALLAAVRLRGDSIGFELTAPGTDPAGVLRFRGRVEGGSMAGEVTADASADRRSWRARRSLSSLP